MRVDMSRKLEIVFGGWVGEGEAIVVLVVVVVVFLEVVCSRGERWSSIWVVGGYALGM